MVVQGDEPVASLPQVQLLMDTVTDASGFGDGTVVTSAPTCVYWYASTPMLGWLEGSGEVVLS